MTKREKIKFVRDLMGSIQKLVISKVDAMPEEWDGHQLRQYIADKTAEQAQSLYLRNDRKALKSYKNEVLVRNL
jgi:hypothetical protein